MATDIREKLTSVNISVTFSDYYH